MAAFARRGRGPGASTPRGHGANAGAFLIGAVDSHGALPVRIVLLRRLAPASAPKPLQIAVADVPIFLLEVCTTALLLAVATAAGPLLLLGALLALLVGRRVCPRLGGLSVLADRRRWAGLATWVALITALALARTSVAAYALVVLALLVAVRKTARSDGGSRCSSLRRSAVRLVRSGSTSSSA